jgi:molybdopterin biosynthesis enzyme
MRERFRAVVEKKIHWYGSDVIDLRFISCEPAEIAATFGDFLDQGADILMAAGGNTIDPLDPLLLALDCVGAEMVHFGAPAHPGSMFWLARKGDIPIINLASCSMYSRATVGDLILPLVMTGQQVTSEDIIDLGYGGLLEREMAFRFPDYDAETSDDEDE